MQRTSDMAPVVKVLGWLASVVVSGVVGLVVVGATHDEFLDCSNPELHESANTTLGRTVAVAASALPVVVAVRLAGGLRCRLSVLATVVAALSLVVWRWLLVADCEWSTAPWSAVPLVVG